VAYLLLEDYANLVLGCVGDELAAPGVKDRANVG
jgi:hypothetical protein